MRTVDRLRVEVHLDTAALACAAADEAAAILVQAVNERGVANAMFATGNSQLAFVDALIDGTRDVPWGAVAVFHMDEYIGVGPDHPAGFRRSITERIVQRVHPRDAFLLDGLADPAVEGVRYTSLLRAHPLDLCCLGIGENGHLAFNDPPADFADPLDVKVVELDRACRQQQVGEGHFERMEAVPTHALTVTVPALLRARSVIAVVPEARKAQPVRAALLGPVSPSCPASALRTAVNATLHLDRGSAGALAWS